MVKIKMTDRQAHFRACDWRKTYKCKRGASWMPIFSGSSDEATYWLWTFISDEDAFMFRLQFGGEQLCS